MEVQCPSCREVLEVRDHGHRCPSCGRSFPQTADGQRDLRLPAGETITVRASYTPLKYDATIAAPLQCEAPCAEVRNRFAGTVPAHLTRDQISYLPQAAEGAIALDLGCGNGIHRGVLEELGYAYHGVDYSGEAADDLIDAHALPYADGVFDLVFSIAVIEHLAQPLVALGEVYRVLRNGGYFIGTAAFLEPFHDNSFCHFTHVGVWYALQATGFEVETIMPIPGWHVARAQVEMGFGARLPRWLTKLLTEPFPWVAESYAVVARLLGGNSERHRRSSVVARHAGAFYFVGRKPTVAQDRK